LCLSPLESGVEVKFRVGLGVVKICPASKFSSTRRDVQICLIIRQFLILIRGTYLLCVVFVTYPGKVCDYRDLRQTG
jgi:ABC-type arginine/histidine transport system permease subunit